MSMKLQLTWIALVLVLLGCGDSNCSRQLQVLSNKDETRTAEIEVAGLCGGATVGYTTHLKLTRHPTNAYGDKGYVWSTRGWINAKVEWIGPTSLRVVYPSTLNEADIFLATTRWYDISISYVAAPRK